MNASLQARSAYTNNQTAIKTPRSIEAQLLGEVTAQLRKAAANSDNYPGLVAAVHRNRQMWTTFAMNIADKDNGLPKELRAQLFYLAEFTEAHSQKILQRDAKATALVEINMSVLKGLTGSRVSS